MSDTNNHTANTADRPPVDLTSKLGGWLRRAIELAEAAPELQPFASSLQALGARRQQPGCQIAIVGQAGRGQIPLINRLFERDLIPERPIYDVPLIVELAFGMQEWAEVNIGGVAQPPRQFEGFNWEELYDQAAASGPPTVVRLTVKNYWLRDADIELVELSSQSGDPVAQVLDHCDLALLVISAQQPLTMTEAALLRDDVLEHHVLRALVIVAELDSVQTDQRAAAVAEACERVARVSANILVLPASSVEAEQGDIAELTAIRQTIAAMVAREHRVAWRSNQVTRRLLGLLKQLDPEIQVKAKDAVRQRRASELSGQQAAERSALSAALDWEYLEAELASRQEASANELQQFVFKISPELIETKKIGLNRTANPQSWWASFSSELEREAAATGRQLAQTLAKRSRDDFSWLQEAVAEHLPEIIIEDPGDRPLPGLRLHSQLERLQLADLNQQRLLTRVGSGAAAIGTYVFTTHVASSVLAGASILAAGEFFANARADQQRAELTNHIPPAVNKVMEQLLTALAADVTDRYRQIQQVLQNAKNATPVIQEDQQPLPVGPDWTKFAADSTALHGEIQAALAR